jgi:predicted CoA-binding protein
LDANWNIQKEAEKKAKENGIDVTYNRCMKIEHSMLID